MFDTPHGFALLHGCMCDDSFFETRDLQVVIDECRASSSCVGVHFPQCYDASKFYMCGEITCTFQQSSACLLYNLPVDPYAQFLAYKWVAFALVLFSICCLISAAYIRSVSLQRFYDTIDATYLLRFRRSNSDHLRSVARARRRP